LTDEFPPRDFLSRAPDAVEDFVKTDAACALVFLHCVVELLGGKKRGCDVPGLLRYLVLLPRLKDKVRLGKGVEEGLQCAHRDVWLHLLVSRLMQSTLVEQLLQSEDVIAVLIEDLLLKSLHVSCPRGRAIVIVQVHVGVKFHCLRVVNFLHHILGETRTREMLERLAPETVARENDSDSESYASAYAKVMEKIARVEKTSGEPLKSPPGAVI
jgi:hypothetical protein